jgi:hypothetical protein
MTVYVRAARVRPGRPEHRPHITGSVLHLGVVSVDPPGTTLFRSSRWIALCGNRYAQVEQWRIAIPGVVGWERHAHWPLCTSCQRVLAELTAAATSQNERHEEGPRVNA